MMNHGVFATKQGGSRFSDGFVSDSDTERCYGRHGVASGIPRRYGYCFYIVPLFHIVPAPSTRVNETLWARVCTEQA